MRSPLMASSLQPRPLKTEAMKLHRELYIHTPLAMPWAQAFMDFMVGPYLNARRLLKSTGSYKPQDRIDLKYFIFINKSSNSTLNISFLLTGLEVQKEIGFFGEIETI